MKKTSSASIALGMIIALNVWSYSSFAASTPEVTQAPTHLHKADFTKAKALAPHSVLMPAPAARVPETDGLSRNDEDCNYGCIDH